MSAHISHMKTFQCFLPIDNEKRRLFLGEFYTNKLTGFAWIQIFALNVHTGNNVHTGEMFQQIKSVSWLRSLFRETTSDEYTIFIRWLHLIIEQISSNMKWFFMGIGLIGFFAVSEVSTGSRDTSHSQCIRWIYFEGWSVRPEETPEAGKQQGTGEGGTERGNPRKG